MKELNITHTEIGFAVVFVVLLFLALWRLFSKQLGSPLEYKNKCVYCNTHLNSAKEQRNGCCADCNQSMMQ